MVIVDAQVHIWDAGTPNPWHRQNACFTKEELINEMDEAGIDRAIIVPPMWMGDTNDLALQASLSYPERLVVLGRLSLDNPENKQLIPAWNEQPGMLGLRFTFSNNKDFSLLDNGNLKWLWEEAELCDVPIMLMISGHLDSVDKIARAYPGLRLCIDHLGLVRNAVDKAAFGDLSKLLSLATHDNIVVKATSLPCYSTAEFPYRNLHPYLRQVYDAFGPSRIFWGSDLTRLTCSYKECLSLFEDELTWLTSEDKTLILGEAICHWLKWDV